MAKINGWLKKSKGKFMGATLYNAGGDTILREIVTPKNPKTNSQMSQRIKFAAMVEFYHRAIQNLFRFAFQNKKRQESDYNAFVRENMAEGVAIFPTREYFKNANAEMIAPWIVTKGSLESVATEFNSTKNMFFYDVKTGDIDSEDWGGFLAANPNLQVGDIVTFVLVSADEKINSGSLVVGKARTSWTISQFIVGEDLGGESLETLLISRGLGTFNYDPFDGEVICKSTLATTDSSMSCVIISRPTPAGLEVSSQAFVLDPNATAVYNYMHGNSAQALTTWGANGDAILQGAVAKKNS